MLPFPDGDARKNTKIYPSSGKRRPYVQRGGSVCIILHLSACTGISTFVRTISLCTSVGIPLTGILDNKLQNLKQGSLSVDEYYKEMEKAMVRANVIEDEEQTIAKFMSGLHRNIQRIVEFQQYHNLVDGASS